MINCLHEYLSPQSTNYMIFQKIQQCTLTFLKYVVSFDRLLVHGVCQFLDLKSTSEYIAHKIVNTSSNTLSSITRNNSSINHKFMFFSAVQSMIFHMFICILHLVWVYYELWKWPAPRSLDSSIGKALHRYRRGNGFKSNPMCEFI